MLVARSGPGPRLATKIMPLLSSGRSASLKPFPKLRRLTNAETFPSTTSQPLSAGHYKAPFSPTGLCPFPINASVLKRTNNKLLVFRTNLDAGHVGAAGRFDYLKEVALAYAFAIKVAGVDGPEISGNGV
jgi:hypothetical protein